MNCCTVMQCSHAGCSVSQQEMDQEPENIWVTMGSGKWETSSCLCGYYIKKDVRNVLQYFCVEMKW